MAGPLAGLGQAQQIPLSTPYQPGNGNNTGQQAVRPTNDQTQQPQPNQVQGGQTSPVNQSQQGNVIEQKLAEASEPTTSGSDTRRGSVIDIQV